MMLPTHALSGMVLGLAVSAVAPEFGPVAIAAGLFGGVFPDLDMYAGHRKTLHFPVYYSLSALLALGLAGLLTSAATVAAALFVLAAAVNSVADAFGGGLELRPWEGASDRGVYDHYHGRWIAPRRLVGYDGSPGDLLLSGALAVPLVLTLDGPFQWVVVGGVAVAGTYTAVRRHLPDVANVLIGSLLVSMVPEALHTHVPDRYLESGR